MYALSQPDKPALVEGDRSLSYGELNELANRAANLLSGLGVGPGDRVATMAYNSIAGYIASAGGQKLGSIGVPISYRLRGAEVAFILNDSGARAVLAGEEFVPVVEEARGAVDGELAYVALAGAPASGWLDFGRLLREAGAHPVDSRRGPGLPPSMIYTSGTTGNPKGAYRG